MSPVTLAQVSNIGLILFIILYILTTFFYDGGSKVFPHKKSWDWINNYWCDLIWATTILEKPNRTSKAGIAANTLLCLTTTLFFFAFSKVFAPNDFWAYTISISGTIAMICSTMIFSKWHDKIIGLIVLTAIPAVVGVIYGLIYFEQFQALYFGIVALILILVNVFIFFTEKGMKFLPLIQKVGFVGVIGWIFYLNWVMG